MCDYKLRGQHKLNLIVIVILLSNKPVHLFLNNRWCNQPISVQHVDCYARAISAVNKMLVMDGYRLQRENVS